MLLSIFEDYVLHRTCKAIEKIKLNYFVYEMPMGLSKAVNFVWNFDTTRVLIPGFPRAPDILPHYHRQP